MKKLITASLLLTVCAAFTSCGADNYNEGYESESFVSTTDISDRDYDHDKRITEDDAERKENSNMSITDNSVTDHIKDAADGVGDAGKDVIDSVGDAGKDVIDGVGDAGKDIIDGAQNAGDELIEGAQDAGDNIIDGMDGESETVETLETDDIFTE